MTSSADHTGNLRAAEGLVRRAAGAGAGLVVLPEKWPFMHARRLLEGAEALDGPSLRAVRSWARELGVAILAGSVVERVEGDARARNTSVLVRPDGTIAAAYRKLHMFDVDVGGVAYRESSVTAPGDEVVVAQVLGRTVGMSLCYDLRFPELYRRLADGGVEIIVVPAAFTAVTGRDHWEPLLRARAIENQAFVVAAGQSGRHEDGTETHGHSMIVDPWGLVLAQIPDGEGLAVADLDFARMEEVRARLPALRHRRLDVY
jgi:predicted amidohydrolase